MILWKQAGQRKVVVAIALAIFLLSSLCPAEEGAGSSRDIQRWHDAGEVGGLHIQHRANSVSGIPDARIFAVLDASPATVYEIISDYDHFHCFVPNVVDSRILRKDARARWVYQHLRFPGPVADRHYVIRVQHDARRFREGVFHVEWQLEPHPSAWPDQVSPAAALMPDAISGSWHLQPGPTAGTTRAIYMVSSDPGGMLPGWLIARSTDRYLLRVIDGIQRRISSSETERDSCGA